LRVLSVETLHALEGPHAAPPPVLAGHKPKKRRLLPRPRKGRDRD
jgi:hypothetical protein